MSDNNRRSGRAARERQGVPGARERMRAERARQEARSRRNRRLGVLGAVAAVIVAAVVAGVAVQNHRGRPDRPTAAPAGTVGSHRLAIRAGRAAAPTVLTVYEDPRCPVCGQFETLMHRTVDSLENQGRLQVRYHIVSFIDRHDDGSGSKNAANALACAQQAGRFRPYHDVLYANQPGETQDAWADRNRLVDLAKKVPGLDTGAFRGCVRDDRFGGWVAAVQQDFDRSGFVGTPTVLLDGQPIFPAKGGVSLSPRNLVTWVAAAGRARTTGVTSPAG